MVRAITRRPVSMRQRKLSRRQAFMQGALASIEFGARTPDGVEHSRSVERCSVDWFHGVDGACASLSQKRHYLRKAEHDERIYDPKD